jgi:activator of 2-hydroxyglutaryl-CoA dehydratase/predicted nucleotide-binding protein (sugar kinase/HSP70/actin superfamily)
MAKPLLVGIDVGSTTVKLVATDSAGGLAFGRYERHRSDVRAALAGLLVEAASGLGSRAASATVAVTGSAGIGEAERLGLPFVQEVMACGAAVEAFLPSADVAIELGGEDAKITYFGDRLEQRMNGSCAGGTGAFLDQMAVLLATDPGGLDDLAARAETIYPIAARCGVFAKADIQPLVNEGARREDLAASVFQAVVNQTISGLACGRPIKGRVAFLGGPLHFLPQLRRRFTETLRLGPADVLLPADGRLFVAMGAALEGRAAGESARAFDLRDLALLAREAPSRARGSERMRPLFSGPSELSEFRERHGAAALPRLDPRLLEGPAFVGIDAGSTTTKLAMIDRGGRLLGSSYAPNGGRPLSVIARALGDLYALLPPGATLGRACATGYGEALARAALGADEGEVETVAHCLAAERLLPGVEAVLDIGGQDMKFLRVKEGVITSVVLNEACSSGCGSFLETFAEAMGEDPPSFASLALESRAPVDLGSRCTVFMNSRVKQSQKEGASPADIAAGLAYAVVRNALQKVIRLRGPADLGTRVVVQGGTFASDAVLRAFELVSGARPLRPAEAPLMGAYGAALVALSRWKPGEASTLIGPGELGSFSYKVEPRRCPGCANACLLTISAFPGRGAGGPGAGTLHVTGNRCERGPELAGVPRSRAREAREAPPDIYAWKYRRLFRYEPLPLEKAPRGRIGLPRVLNLYENYPLWFTLLTELGFRVELSPRSSKAIYELGMDTIPSESVCYPAKLVHGHAAAIATRLLGDGAGPAERARIFYPCVPRERRFVAGSRDRFNCPIVASYPEVILNNVDAFRDGGVEYLDPFLPLADSGRLALRVAETFAHLGVALPEARAAVEAARVEEEAFRAELRAAGEEALAWIERTGGHGIVLAGRPYHVDPEIHHGIPSIAAELGMAVLSEDSIAHLGEVARPLRVVDQWSYHSRLYAAASFVARRGDLDLVQLVSFGCGLDAVTSDQVAEILERAGKIYTGIKIDEHANLGAARIRLRSLAAAIAGRRGAGPGPRAGPEPRARALFTKAMRDAGYTILAPQMSPIHFSIVEEAFRLSGYDFEIPAVSDREAVDEGLRAVHNDACYPTILVVGQLLSALRSGRYDPDRTALLVTQTGGGCRATNYIAFLRKALADSGFGRVPVISLSPAGLESNPGFRASPLLVLRALRAVAYGDALMRCLYRTRPYEAERGSAQRLALELGARCEAALARPGRRAFENALREIVSAFDDLPKLDRLRRPRIGVVGEILVKFHPEANGRIVELIEAEGGEAVVPDLYGFLLYSSYNGIFRRKYLEGSLKEELLSRAGVALLERLRAPLSRALAGEAGIRGRFGAPLPIAELARGVDGIVQLGNCTGEGWFLTAEMVELIKGGVDGIVCLQPFACLPNHVTGKGMLKELRRRYPSVPVSAIDFDPGASEVNQLNRLKLLMANAKRRGGARGLRTDCPEGHTRAV